MYFLFPKWNELFVVRLRKHRSNSVAKGSRAARSNSVARSNPVVNGNKAAKKLFRVEKN